VLFCVQVQVSVSVSVVTAPFSEALADPGFRHGELVGVEAAVSAGPWKRLAIAATMLAGVFAVTVVVLTSLLLDQPTPEVFRYTVPLGQDADLYLGVPFFGRPPLTSLTFSPDGDLLVYAGWKAGEGSRLYSQRLDQERADPIEGEGAAFPFFSPDGAWIGFFGDGSLRRVSVADGAIERIAQSGGQGATWGDDGTIVWVQGNSLYQVAATGGEPVLLAEPDPLPGELLRYSQPHMLPGSEVLLFHAMRSFDPAQSEIVALDLTTGAQKTVLTDAMDPRYVQTGHLLFMRQGTLMADGFDAERLETLGQPVIMVEDVMHAVFMLASGVETGAGQVAVSASGHLAYALGGVYPEVAETAVRVTSTGEIVPLDLDRRDYGVFRVSPDGNRIAFHAGTGQHNDIWVHNLDTGVSQRLNPGGFSNSRPVWSPDGRWLAFASDRDQAQSNIYRFRVDGTGEPERLAPSNRDQRVSSWSSQGVIAYLEEDDSGALDIWVLPLPDGTPEPFFTSDAVERYPTFSPDGNWLAYTSDQSGRQEVYVRPYPGPEPAIQISGKGGSSPAWSPDGRQIYYNQGRVLMAVDVTPGDEFQAGRPASFIDPWHGGLGQPVRTHDVFADGSFVTTVQDDDGSPLEQFGVTEFHVILNFFEELKERVPN